MGHPHWASTPRAHSALLQVDSVGYTADKRYRVNHPFSSCNFSLILSGSGSYRLDGRTWKVEAPCVLLQWPGPAFNYGPDGENGTWEEFFIIYSGGLRAELERRQFFDTTAPVYPLANPAAVRDALPQLVTWCKAPRPEQVVDYFDRLCERILLDTRLAPAKTQPDTLIERLRLSLAEGFDQALDLDAVARAHGLSSSGFRRLWARHHSEPPWQYILSLRIREACRYLAETDLPIKTIALRVGFEDALYFSRRFQHAMATSPRDYRKNHRFNPVYP